MIAAAFFVFRFLWFLPSSII